MTTYEKIADTLDKCGYEISDGMFIDGWDRRTYGISPAVLAASEFHNTYGVVVKRESQEADIHIPVLRAGGRTLVLKYKDMSKIAEKIADTLVKNGFCDYCTQISPSHGRTGECANTITTAMGCKTDQYMVDSIEANGKFVDAFHESVSDIAAAVSTGGPGQNRKCFTIDEMRIRKLTERECFRLMGVRDEDIDKIQSVGISKTQQYKLAGNSIVADNFLASIFAELFKDRVVADGHQANAPTATKQTPITAEDLGENADLF